MSALSLNLDLARKYSVPGPRYTSYPPAPQFTEKFSVDLLTKKLSLNNEIARDLSLYFHLPFCQSHCWFCGCNTVITTKQEQSAIYLRYLEKELDQTAKLLHPKRRLKQLHFGGGTPTFLKPEEIRALGKMIRNRFTFSPELEAGVEVDPRRLTEEHVIALRESGFNRASLGVQDHNPQVQEAVHRLQPLAVTRQTVDWLRASGFESVNIDLIYGLPFQTVESFTQTLEDILELQPNRLAVFSYAHVPWIKPAQKILEKQVLPTADEKLQLLKLSIEMLTRAGYEYIGMDHFARPDDELAVAQRQKTLQRNFQGYSTCGGADIYAFGMSAISQVDDMYWQNVKELPAYYAALDAGRSTVAKGYVLTADDQLRRQTIMRLMCDLSLDYRSMSELLGIDFPDYFRSEIDSLADMEADGLLLLGDSELTVTDTGRLFIRNIAMRFDAYLLRQTERRYSKTI